MAQTSTTLGYSSLGLPLWGASPSEREALLDVVFEEAGYDVLELHVESGADRHAIVTGGPALDASARAQIAAIAAAVARRGGRLVLGLGARHLLGPIKHEPSLISDEADGRALRLRLMHEVLVQAADVGVDIIVFLSGPSPRSDGTPKYQSVAWARFEAVIESLLAKAELHRVTLAPEAHSAHLFSSPGDYFFLRQRLPSARLGLTGDTVHQTLTEARSLEELYRELSPCLSHVQLDNLAALPTQLGQPLHKVAIDQPGIVNVASALRGLYRGGYGGSVSVELIRDDHPGVEAASVCRRVARWLKATCNSLASNPRRKETCHDRHSR